MEQVPVKDRAQVLFRFKQLEKTTSMPLLNWLVKRMAKHIANQKLRLKKGPEVTEFATSLPQIYNQELLEVSRGVDCASRRYPLGVVAGITPFNFPAMVPLWMIPIAIGTGNTLFISHQSKSRLHRMCWLNTCSAQVCRRVFTILCMVIKQQ